MPWFPWLIFISIPIILMIIALVGFIYEYIQLTKLQQDFVIEEKKRKD